MTGVCKSPETRARKTAGWREARAKAHAGEGYIYLAAIGDGVVKIGFSLNPEDRLRKIDRCGHKGRLRLLAKTPGSWGREKELHIQLRDHCLGSEIYPRSILSHPAIPPALRYEALAKAHAQIETA